MPNALWYDNDIQVFQFIGLFRQC